MVFLVHAKFTIVLLVDGVGADFVGAVEPYHGVDAFVDSARKDETSVIIGVLAYEVDTAWGSVGNTLVSKALLEDRFQFFNGHRYKMFVQFGRKLLKNSVVRAVFFYFCGKFDDYA